ncbi:MAG: hypothetical protein O2975_03775 [Proteobacteria bacterium]|nr:hypothetical protein [Pseudomonadota bacterium]
MNTMRRTLRPQRGVTLLVVLVMLVVITLLGIASIRMSGSSMLIVGNMQARKFVEGFGLQAIEQVMNSSAPFSSPTAAQAFTAPAGIAVAIGNRSCVHSAAATGYSLTAALSPEDNNWEFQVDVTDSFTGARTRMVQGVRIRQLSGSCS